MDTVSSKKIIKAREKAGHNRAQAAAVIGYSRQAWSTWENGTRKMRKSLFDLYLLKIKGEQ